MKTSELRRWVKSQAGYAPRFASPERESRTAELAERAPLTPAHVVALGEELKRRGLKEHVEHLREFFTAWRSGWTSLRPVWTPAKSGWP